MILFYTLPIEMKTLLQLTARALTYVKVTTIVLANQISGVALGTPGHSLDTLLSHTSCIGRWSGLHGMHKMCRKLMPQSRSCVLSCTMWLGLGY